MGIAFVIAAIAVMAFVGLRDGFYWGDMKMDRKNIIKIWQDLMKGNAGRKAWLEQPAGHPAGEVLMMLSGATKDLDKALEIASDLRRRVLDQRKELRRLNRKLKDRQLGAQIYKAAVTVGAAIEEAKPAAEDLKRTA